MEDPQNVHLIVHFVDRDEGEWCEYQLASPCDPAGAPAIRQCREGCYAFDDRLGCPASGGRAVLDDVVTNVFEISGC